MRRPRWTLRLLALALASVSLTGTVLPLSRAGANPVADKRAEAAKIAAQIYADNRRVDSLTARFEAAQLAASDVDARMADSAAALKAVRLRIAQTGLAVRDLAVAEFMNGGRTSAPVAAMLGQVDLQGFNIARLYADLAISKTQDVLDASKAAQEDYQARLADLGVEQKRAHAAAASLQAARGSAERAVAEQQAHLGKVQGDLAGLVAAEQARQQAAREARTRATVARNDRPPLGTTPGPPVDGRRASIAVAEARRQLGKPYHWGAAGPDSFDCSGLTMWAWRAAGVALAHYSGAQYSATTHIPLSELQPGDLVFFYSDLSHVGIYVGGGQMIHAPQTGDVVRYASIFAEGSPIYAGRVTG
jgi:cell wall-associated NlpC family hydrolase